MQRTPFSAPCFSGRVDDNFIEARVPGKLHEVMAVDKTRIVSPRLRRGIYLYIENPYISIDVSDRCVSFFVLYRLQKLYVSSMRS